MSNVTFDIEAPGLYYPWDSPADKIDCYVQVQDGEAFAVTSEQGLPGIHEGDRIIGHSIIPYLGE